MHCLYQYTVKTFLKHYSFQHTTLIPVTTQWQCCVFAPISTHSTNWKIHKNSISHTSVLALWFISMYFHIYLFYFFVKILKPFLNLNKNIFNGLGKTKYIYKRNKDKAKICIQPHYTFFHIFFTSLHNAHTFCCSCWLKIRNFSIHIFFLNMFKLVWLNTFFIFFFFGRV